MVSKSRNRTFIVLIAIFGIISFGIIKVGSEDLESYNVAIEDYGKFDDSWSLKPQKCDKEDPPLYDRAHVASNERFWSTIGDAEVKKLRSEWKSFVRNVPKRLPGGGKGIVYTCSSGIVKFALASIKLLRLYGCNLPIEVWYNGDELFKSHIDAFLAIPGVMPRDFKSIQSQVDLKQPEGDKMFEAKGAAILYSSFEQVIFMDSDNMPVKDPTFLFDTKPFLETGAIFWKDFWKTKASNPIWRILDIECDGEYEQESGQLVVDKSRNGTWKALNFAFYMQRNRQIYFKLLGGDKDTFKYAWRALKVPFHMVTPHLGIISQGECGHTMVQFSPSNEPKFLISREEKWHADMLFFHINLLKYYDGGSKGYETTFEYFHHTPLLLVDNIPGEVFTSNKQHICTKFKPFVHDNKSAFSVKEPPNDIIKNFTIDYFSIRDEVAKLIDN